MPQILELFTRGDCNLKLDAIKLSDPQSGGTPINPPCQLLRVGKFNHPKYGEFEVTATTLSEMKANFDRKIRGVDVAFDYFHDSDKEASGWPTRLYLSSDGLELWADVDWTPPALVKLSNRELRYFSPDFAFKWTDPESNVTYKNVLFGGGLTNRPFVKDMAAIVASETKEEKKMTPEQLKILADLQAAVLKLSEDAAKPAAAPDMEKLMSEHAEMKKKLAEYAEKEKAAAPVVAAPAVKAADSGAEPDTDDPAELKKRLSAAKEENAKLCADAKKLDEAKQMAERAGQFTVLLSEGKACAAQKDAFMSNDMTKFIKLAQPVNLKSAGSGAGAGEGTGEGTRDERVLKLAEEKVKADPKLSKIDAMTLANKEIKA